jgi:hypothetical protein
MEDPLSHEPNLLPPLNLPLASVTSRADWQEAFASYEAAAAAAIQEQLEQRRKVQTLAAEPGSAWPTQLGVKHGGYVGQPEHLKLELFAKALWDVFDTCPAGRRAGGRASKKAGTCAPPKGWR